MKEYQSPLFSVIIPVFNVAEYLYECLESIAQQDYPFFECLIIDDGSTDASPQICDLYCDKDSRFRCIHKENGGLSDARNVGIDNSKGVYILFVDSDDYISPKTLSLLHDYIEKNNEPDVLCCNIQTFGKRIQGFPFSDKVILYEGNPNVQKSYYDRQWYEMACNKAVKRELVLSKKMYFLKGVKHEDTLWSFQLVLCANSVLLDPTITYFYRIRENSIMSSMKSVDNAKYLHTVFRCMADFAKKSKNTLSMTYDYLIDLMISSLISSVVKVDMPEDKKRYFFYAIYDDICLVNRFVFMFSDYSKGIKILSILCLCLSRRCLFVIFNTLFKR